MTDVFKTSKFWIEYGVLVELRPEDVAHVKKLVREHEHVVIRKGRALRVIPGEKR